MYDSSVLRGNRCWFTLWDASYVSQPNLWRGAIVLRQWAGAVQKDSDKMNSTVPPYAHPY